MTLLENTEKNAMKLGKENIKNVNRTLRKNLGQIQWVLLRGGLCHYFQITDYLITMTDRKEFLKTDGILMIYFFSIWDQHIFFLKQQPKTSHT